MFSTSRNEDHNTLFLSSCIPESRFFLYRRYFSKNKNRIKLVGRSITYSYDKIRKDYFISIGYGLKNFFTFNTNIVHNMRKNHCKFPMKTTSLLQQRSRNLSIFEKHIIFKSHQDFRYRNLSVKLKPFKNQLLLEKTTLLTKPLNKAMFFALFKSIQNLSLNSTVFILFRTWRTNLMRVYHLGFRFLLENASLKKTMTKNLRKVTKKQKSVFKLTYKKKLFRKQHFGLKEKRTGNIRGASLKKSFVGSSKGNTCASRGKSLFLKRTQVMIVGAYSISKQKK